MIDEKRLMEELKQSGMIVDNEYGNAMVDIIENQPKIGDWVPCSERLPEKPIENPVFENKQLELYLVSIDCEKYPFRAFWNGEFFTDGWSKVNAVAWMPLQKQFNGNR